MTTFDQFERELPGVLEDLYLGPTPPYRDDLLRLTAHTSQRPGWTFLERWLPVDAVTQRVTVPPFPWRVVGATALLILAFALGAALLVGNRPNLPPPFGRAETGKVLVATGGEIVAIDLATGQADPLISGPESDSDPVWSLDGTRFAFERAGPGLNMSSLFVAQADGSDIRAISAEPVSIASVSFSPDGRDVMFQSGEGEPTISIAPADGGPVRTLAVGMPAFAPEYRPPDGAEILFVGRPTGDSRILGLYAVNADGTGLRTLFQPSLHRTIETARWSPDGSQIAYGIADVTSEPWTVRVHVMSADGTDRLPLPLVTDETWSELWSGGPVWSNDGSRVAMVRGYSPNDDSDAELVIAPVDRSAIHGGDTGIGTGRGLISAWPRSYAWAPDDSSILVTPAGEAVNQLIIDPETGESRPASWASSSAGSFQRLAAQTP